MLSNEAFKLLKWFEKHDEWMTREQIANENKTFDDRAFKAITKDFYVETQLSLDEDSWAKYRISDSGKAYLEGAQYARVANIREWMSFGLSVAAIVISAIALLMQEGML